MAAPVLEQAAGWAAGLRPAGLDATVAHHAKRAVVDWFSAAVPGGTMAPATILAAALADGGEGGHARLVPGGRRVPVRTAALVNGAAAHTAEVDDIFREGIYHPGAPTIAAALATAQQAGKGGAQLLAAVVAGFELSTRVAAAVQPSHYRYWHTTGTVGTIGAAAAAASLLELEPDQFAHALATATTMAAGLQQAFRSDAMSKPLHAGHAADAGVLAALAASRGFTGALDILEGEAGFAAATSEGADWGAAFADLGEAFNVTRMTVKNHACCGHTFAAVDGALELRAGHGLAPAEVASVRVDTYETALKVAGNTDPATEFEAKFSIPYCVAAALALGSVRLDAFTGERLRDPELRRLVAAVELAVDPGLDAAFPGQRGARVRVTRVDGTVLETTRPTRKGDPDLPLTDAELDGKFLELVAGPLGRPQAEALAARLWSLEDAGDLRELLPAAGGTAP